MLGPWARGVGHGHIFLAHVQNLARAAQAPQLFLAVLGANRRGRAFWEREGFQATGVRGGSTINNVHHTLHRLVKRL